jgi:hypothetical protein
VATLALLRHVSSLFQSGINLPTTDLNQDEIPAALESAMADFPASRTKSIASSQLSGENLTSTTWVSTQSPYELTDKFSELAAEEWRKDDCDHYSDDHPCHVFQLHAVERKSKISPAKIH